MSDVVTKPLQVQLTSDDYLSANKAHARPLRSLLIFAAGGVIIAAIELAGGGAAHLVTDVVVPVLLYGAIVGGWFVAFRLVIVPWRSRRVYRQQVSMQRPHTVIWDNEVMATESAEFSARTPWRDFLKWRENERLFMLYLSDIMFRIVPKRAFADDKAIGDFRALLAAKIAPKPGTRRK